MKECKMSDLMEEMRECVDDLVLEIYLNSLIENDIRGDKLPRGLAKARTTSFLTDYASSLQFTFDHLDKAFQFVRGESVV